MRRAKSRTLISQRLHEDTIISLSILKHNDQLGSAIRDIGFDKFFIHIWSDLQLKVYNESYIKKKVRIISFDAIGGVCIKLKRHGNKMSSAIFLYEGVMSVSDKSFTALSMLSERHDNISIFVWLKRWLRDGAKSPKMTVSDQSITLMSGITQAFTQYQSLKEYLEACFVLVQRTFEGPILKCFIRNDINHFIHLITQWKPLKTAKHPSTKPFFSRAMSLLVYCTSMDDAEKILEAIFII